jgi:integrase
VGRTDREAGHRCADIHQPRARQGLKPQLLIRHSWKPALVAAGLIAQPEPGQRYQESREYGFHALRHAFASALLAEGVDIRSLAEYLGHSDPGFTLRVYCHLMPSSEDKTRRAVDRAFCTVDGSVGPKLGRVGA